MKELKEMDIGELAAYICSYLNDNGVICTLSGGACVSIYTSNKYMSYDLDFIESGSSPRKVIINLMKTLGFREKYRYFINDEVKYFIEFPMGPLSVRLEPIKEINEITYDTGTLRLLTPTDCVKDRLAAFYHWEDKQSLEQAYMVAQKHKINIKEIEKWSRIEGKLKQFKSIEMNLRQKKKK